MEQGIPVQAAPAAAYGRTPAPAVGGLGTDPVQENPAAQPAGKAAPEDLQKIRARWKMIAGQAQEPFRHFLLNAVPKYNRETGEARLFVEFQNNLAAMYLERPDARQELLQIIEQTIGKTVDLEMILADQKKNSALSEISVDSLLQEAVHMPIDYDDDDEEPEEFE